MFDGLSLDQAPPIKIPYRMFLTAPLFGVLAGVVLLLFASEGVNRFSSEIIAIAHLLFIGFAGFVMIGAIYQMLPVVVGVRFLYQESISIIVFFALSIGLLLFVSKYLFGVEVFGLVASLFLGIGYLLFAGGVLVSIFKKAFSTPTAISIFFASIFLLLGALIGAHLLSANALQNIDASYFRFLDVHIFTMLFGWILLPVIGIAFQVVPMFWVTKEYPLYCKKFITPLLIVIVILFFLSSLTSLNLELYLIFVAFIPIFSFGTITIRRLIKRKRRHFDIVVLCWQVALLFLMLAALLFALSFVVNFDFTMLVALFISLGFLATLLMGMLYKIVPFLAWFHLNAKGIFDAPMMAEMVDEKYQFAQLATHIASNFLLLCWILCGFDLFRIVAAFLMIISFSLLFLNLLNVHKSYKRKSHV